MPTVKYQRFPLVMTGPDEDVTLPEQGFLQAELVGALPYISAIFSEETRLVPRTISFLKNGDAREADHVADLGLICPPYGEPVRVVILGVLPAEVRAARRAAAAGILPATSFPKGA